MLVAQQQNQHELQLKIKYPMLVVWLKKQTMTQKLSGLEKKLTDHNHDKYITIPEFNTFAADVFNSTSKFNNKDRFRC